ncbi:T6SS amidase immunity protein Tai4 family protein [Acinetobacter stercoris]|uniref:Uncharacterized protein n=1 Tax=Acinetobacter stercoris TaxID=2126983 RepID=A0A2U3MYB4_9GAMM|nr:T6SS amidase immunity protein Tai4 family protein [Acinetobacter stercoris]SPL70299.1 hypothetical protein KPC_1477 [Acinetobacter stercoris]
MRLIVLLLSVLLINACYAKTTSSQKHDELNLKNFGFTYCLTKSDDKFLGSEASQAMGGYFEKGVYDVEAYNQLKSYINKYLTENKSIYKESGMSSNLMKCLDLYNSSGYEKLIQKQKVFLIEDKK